MKGPRARRQETRASDKCRLRLKPGARARARNPAAAAPLGLASRDQETGALPATDDPRMVGGGKPPRSLGFALRLIPHGNRLDVEVKRGCPGSRTHLHLHVANPAGSPRGL